MTTGDLLLKHMGTSKLSGLLFIYTNSSMTCEAMMPVAQKSAISFALVHIPVELFLATQDNDIHFNQLTSDMKRVRYRKTDGAGHELKNDDIVRGFQYEKDRYVIVTDDDIEKIKTEKETVSISCFLQTCHPSRRFISTSLTIA